MEQEDPPGEPTLNFTEVQVEETGNQGSLGVLWTCVEVEPFEARTSGEDKPTLSETGRRWPTQ